MEIADKLLEQKDVNVGAKIMCRHFIGSQQRFTY